MVPEWIIYNWTEDGDKFTQHVLRTTNRLRTFCDLKLPEDYDDTWFYDHDRDDVVPCDKCREYLNTEEAIYFDVNWILARVYSSLNDNELGLAFKLMKRIEGIL